MKSGALKPVILLRTSCWKPVTIATVTTLTTIASAILKIDMRTIGLETLIPCSLFWMRRRDMKISKDKVLLFKIQKYTKLLCLKTIFVFLLFSCVQNVKGEHAATVGTVVIDDTVKVARSLFPMEKQEVKKPLLGIDRLHLFVDSLAGKRIAVVGNQTSVVQGVHLVDTLLSLKLNVVKVFSPEHGFRGDVDAGEKVDHSVDEKTGIPLVSLYGNNKKPSPAQLDDVDVISYDIQDVGVRS